MSGESLDADHVCFGCHKRIGSGEPHIHVPMDEWAATVGKDPLGMDDLLTMAFCEPCTVEARKGWHLDAHDVVVR